MKLLLITHFGLADGLKNSLSYFNEEILENVTAISAFQNDVEPLIELEKFFQALNPDEKVLIFSDIMGGSVNQYCIPYIEKGNVYLFAGVNFPMILQASFLNDDVTEEEISNIEQVGKDSIQYMNKYNFNNLEEEDE